MRADIGLIPKAKDAPVGQMGGTSGDIPVIYLDEMYGSVAIQFSTSTPDATIIYLTKLAEEARALAAKVAEAQS